MNAEEIFNKAVEITDRSERAAYLAEACQGNPDLRAEVQALIDAHEQAGDFLESPPAGAGITLNNPAKIEGPGTTIGRYELLELIGEGGMGLVYLAEQKEPVRRKVAFKIIKPGMDSRQVVARFEAERQTLAVLDHPNIAHVFDAGCTETGRPYFVMEYVKGMSITRYCDENKLTIEQRLRLFEQVCEAVHHAHQKGIIHRDLKPSNILVSVHSDRPVPKIIDFGIAKAITQPLTDKTFITFQGQLLGTPEYMSPEQVDLATQDIDTRSDIYSLGVVLYELLAGVLPFESESFAKAGLAEIQQTIRDQEPASPSIRLTSLGEKAKTIAASRGTQVVPLARRLHRELEWIPLKAMRKDRCRRYKSASEMADDLRNYLNGNPLLAGPETTIYRVQKFVRRHAGSVTTAALVAGAIVLGLVVSTTMYFRSEHALQRETAARTEAEDARQKESLARGQAERAEQTTKVKAEELRRTLYVNSIQLADAKHREGNAKRVRELLESCPNDLRGWEWNRLNYIADQSIMTLRGHEGGIDSVALSLDGKRIVSGSVDKTVKLWDAETGTEVITMRGHSAVVTAVAFSPDGRQVVSGSHDRTVKVWDTSSGKELMTLRGHRATLLSVKFSPDGKRIVSGSYDKLIKVWDAKTGAEVMTLRGLEINSVAFSPNGKHIASGDVWGEIKVWDAVTGNEEMTLRGYGYDNGWVPSISFSPDGKSIVSGWGNEIKIWDVSTGTETRTLRGHDGPTMSVTFSQDGKHIVSGGMDNMIKVWDVTIGREMVTLHGHEGYVHSVAFTPDGKQVVSGSADGTIKVWDLSVDRESTRIAEGEGTLTSIVFSPDGQQIASGGYAGEIKIWDVESDAELMTLRAHEDIFSIAFSSGGKRIVSGGVDKTIRLWDVVTGTELMILRGHQGYIECVTFSPDDKRIVSGSRDGTVKVWNAVNGAELMTLRGHKNIVMSVAFSPDGKHIASGGFDGEVKLWDVASATEVMSFSGHERGIYCVVFSPDGKCIASTGGEGMVKIWNSATGVGLLTLEGHSGAVSSVAFSPDGKRIISGGRSDRTVRVWDIAKGTELMTLRANLDQVHSVAFSPDGRTIAGGDRAGHVVLWESTTPAGGYEPRKKAEAARKTVDELHEKHGSYHEVIRQLHDNMTLESGVRKLAIQIADSREWEDAEKLRSEAWGIAGPADKDGEAYEAALQKAQQANGWEPNDSAILDALGAAQYRTGAYEEALKTLANAEKLAGDKVDPLALAFRAMTLHRLSQADEAKATLEELRTLLKDERFADDQEAKGLLAEAEGVIEGGKK